MPAVQELSSNWHRTLAALVGSAKSDLVVCSPFVSREGTEFLATNIGQPLLDRGRVRFLTNLAPANVVQLSTDPRAILAMVNCVHKMTVRHLPGLHAKVYIADDEGAIITSGNLTGSGLFRNIEYGVEIRNRRIVRRIRRDLSELAELGAEIPPPRLKTYCDAIEEITELASKIQRSTQATLVRQFRDAFKLLRMT